MTESASPEVASLDDALEAVGVTSCAPNGDVRLEPTTWRIHGGEIHGLVGESGAGKTTLARILAGLDRPRRGSLRWRGERVWSPRPSRAFWRAVQYLPQDPAATLDPKMTVGASIREAMRPGDARSVEHFMERVGLPPGFAGRRPDRLSGGQRQRAGWARLLAVEPRIVVLDEPLTALDPRLACGLEAVIRSEREAGVGFVIVSHDLEAVFRLASRIGVVWRGRIVERGPTERIRRDPRHPITARLWATVPSAARTD